MSISRNASYNLVGSLIPMALALATVPIYLKLVGADRYGVLSIAWLLLGYFGLFDLGLGRATTYRISALREADNQARADVFWTAIVVNIGMGAVGAAVLWVAADYFFAHIFKVDPKLRPEIVASVPYLAASVPVATLTGVLTGALQGRERFLETNMISVLSTTLFQLFPLAVAWFVGPELGPLLAAALLARFIAIMVLWWRCHRLLTRGNRHRYDRAEAKQLLGYGGWVTVTAIFGPFLVITDRFAIGAVLGATAVTIYTVPFQLAQRISILPNALITALFPRLPTASEEERIQLTAKAIRVLLAAVSPPILAAIYLVYPFFDLWIGKTLGHQSAEVGVLIILGFWVNVFGVIPYGWLQATGRPDLVTKLLLVQIPPYLLFLYLGMHFFGLIGSAAVFAIRCVADAAMMSWAARRRIDQWQLIATAAAILLTAMLLTSWLSYAQPLWWASLAVLLAILSVFCWAITPPDIKDRVRGMVGARIARLAR